MKTWVRKTLSVGVLAAGALLFAPGAAQADVSQTNGVNSGILNGTQLVAPVAVPVNVTGNSLAILGAADAQGASANVVEGGRRSVQRNGINSGIANGTQAYLPISVPVNAVGNSAAVGGFASANGVGVNKVRESGRVTEDAWQGNGLNSGIGNGTQVYAPISVPVNVCGNSIALLGGAFSQGICGNSVHSDSFTSRRGMWRKAESKKVTEGAWQGNGINSGIANGTQLYAPVSLPVNLSGNAVGVLGVAGARAVSGNQIEAGTTRRGGGPDIVQQNGLNSGILNGTQLAAPISVPVNVCGNAIGVLGAAQSAAACVNRIGDDDRGFIGGAHWDGGWDGGWNGGGWNGGGWGHDDDDFDGDWGHGKPGHGKPGKPGGNLGDKGDDDYKGDRGNDDDYKGDNGVSPDKNDDGYGNKADDDKGEEPDVSDDKGYGATAPDATGSDSKSKGGRGKSSLTEAGPVTGLTDTVGGLGLLNTLR